MIEANRTAVRRLVDEVFNGGHLEVLDELCTPQLAGAARRWQQGTEMSPGELARHALSSAKTGSSAGVQAWRAAPTGVDVRCHRAAARPR